MRVVRWFFRGAKSDATATCRDCGLAIEPCPECRGDWQGRACACGTGRLCQGCGRHWT